MKRAPDRCVVLAWVCGILAGAAAPAAAGPSFHAWVAEGYSRREPLRGWHDSARLMGADWGGGEVRSGATAAQLRGFLQGIAGREAVVYLAAHHEPEGMLDLPEDGRVAWREVWPESGTGRWTVVLDICHAEAALAHLPTAPFWITTSAAEEKAWELRLFSPRTNPLGRSQRSVLEALRAQLGPQWDGRISTWGLGWKLSSTGEGGVPPSTPACWEARVRRGWEALAGLEVRRPLFFRSTWRTHGPGSIKHADEWMNKFSIANLFK